MDGEVGLLIDGKLVEASSGQTFVNINPATEEPIGETADAGAPDMDAAISAARRAFDSTAWATDPSFRRRCLEQLQTALRDERERLRELLVAEAGTPILLTYLIQLDMPIDDLTWWAELAERYEYERPLPDASAFGMTSRRLVWREAAGVVGAITPWNFPLYLNLAKLGPALAAGCTVVLKPAPDTPWSATELGRLIAERTDIPPGVVNVVPSSDPMLGELLTTDPRVDMITFTGSTVTGRRVMASAAATVKRVFLELGGKSAHVVLDDADLTAAVPMAAMGVCTHAGQGCAISTRLLLPRSRYEEGVELARSAMEGVRCGDPRDPSVLIGPLISARQRDRVLGYVARGREEGRVVLGGGRPADLERGYYVEPTLFADVEPAAVIAQEEIFGPVLVVIPHDGDDDAVRIANQTMYGLSGVVSGGDEGRALGVARRMRTGTVGINGGQWIAVDSPFGGFRQSGVGREGGIEGFEQYLETKTIGLPT
ncbi:MAG: aldehyde dehydrogenase family protein [Acidimicrobiales bacterium]